MENVQQNDWFATILYNPDKDFKNFKAMRAERAGHPIETVGAELRKMMPFVQGQD